MAAMLLATSGANSQATHDLFNSLTQHFDEVFSGQPKDPEREKSLFDADLQNIANSLQIHQEFKEKPKERSLQSDFVAMPEKESGHAEEESQVRVKQQGAVKSVQKVVRKRSTKSSVQKSDHAIDQVSEEVVDVAGVNNAEKQVATAQPLLNQKKFKNRLQIQKIVHDDLLNDEEDYKELVINQYSDEDFDNYFLDGDAGPMHQAFSDSLSARFDACPEDDVVDVNFNSVLSDLHHVQPEVQLGGYFDFVPEQSQFAAPPVLSEEQVVVQNKFVPAQVNEPFTPQMLVIEQPVHLLEQSQIPFQSFENQLPFLSVQPIFSQQAAPKQAPNQQPAFSTPKVIFDQNIPFTEEKKICIDPPVAVDILGSKPNENKINTSFGQPSDSPQLSQFVNQPTIHLISQEIPNSQDPDEDSSIIPIDQQLFDGQKYFNPISTDTLEDPNMYQLNMPNYSPEPIAQSLIDIQKNLWAIQQDEALQRQALNGLTTSPVVQKINIDQNSSSVTNSEENRMADNHVTLNIHLNDQGTSLINKEPIYIPDDMKTLGAPNSASQHFENEHSFFDPYKRYLLESTTPPPTVNPPIELDNEAKKVTKKKISKRGSRSLLQIQPKNVEESKQLFDNKMDLYTNHIEDVVKHQIMKKIVDNDFKDVNLEEIL